MKNENETLTTIKSNSKQIDDIVTIVVDKFCGDLDKYIESIRGSIENKEYTLAELNDIILQMPLFLYRLSAGHEMVGVREDVSKLVRDEAFNKIFLTTEGAVQAKKSKAELDTQLEELYRVAYSRAYRTIQHKVEAGTRLMDSAKKIITANMIAERQG